MKFRFAKRRHFRLAMLIALVLPALVVWARLAFEARPERTPFLHSSWTIIGVSWLGGLWPGLVATAWFLGAAWGVFPGSASTGTYLVVLFQGLIFSWFGEARWRAVARWQQLTSQLETRVAERTAALQASNARLEQEAGERERAIAELTAAGRQLQASNRELETFASVASHDLQEPLRKIRTFSDRLMQRHAGKLDPEGRDYLTRSANAAERMTKLIEDLLMYSRVTTHAQPEMPVDLSEVAAGVLSDLETRIADSHAQVHVEPLPKIQADAAQMRQLLQNLIANALKFVGPGQVPEVWVSGRIEPGAGAPICRLEVADHGIGIEERHHEKIFEMFQRLHGRETYEGTGIGLAICRKIAERHGGEIRVAERPGGGSLFVVTLPVNRKSAAGEDAPDAPSL
ncbi:MAG TPA: ATP-binding protein [Thermoanaerobaculia bacterium]|nr:ATP-binding protein [Thermoanaerobaculia bacterium]